VTTYLPFFKHLSSFLGVVSRPSRPSPNAAPVEIVTTSESQAQLSDTHYDRLESMLIEKIQIYVQGGIRNISLYFKYFDLFYSSNEICI
jgi:hypothetical protein